MDYTQYKQLEFRRKVLKLVGAEITISDIATETQVGFIKMAAWKLKEDIRLFTDSSQTQEVFAIKARTVIDFGATYDITDSATATLICSLQRKGLRSTFVRDYWNILDATGTKIGFIQETSGILALVRRWLSAFSDLFNLVFAFVTESYEIRLESAAGTGLVGTVLHRKNPFVVKMLLDTSASDVKADPRLAIAATAMLAIMDANKNS
jgi:hypothetical protein